MIFPKEPLKMQIDDLKLKIQCQEETDQQSLIQLLKKKLE